MTPRTWVLKKAEQDWIRGKGSVVDYGSGLLLKEHARAVRIVKRALSDIENGVPPADRSGYIMACNDILAALQQGRGKGGKGCKK